MKKLIEAYQAAISAIAKRATLKDTRHALAAVERENNMGTCYGSDTKTKAAFVEYCESRIALLNNAGRVLCEVEAHEEALEMDKGYQVAIATIADNLTLPVWEGCSDTVKAEVVKHHHAEALEMNSQMEARKKGRNLVKQAKSYFERFAGSASNNELIRFIGAEVAGGTIGAELRKGIALAADCELIARTAWSA